MKRTSIRELHTRTSELVSDAAKGTVIVIERRGEPVAELRPLSKKSKAGSLTGFERSLGAVSIGNYR